MIKGKKIAQTAAESAIQTEHMCVNQKFAQNMRESMNISARFTSRFQSTLWIMNLTGKTRFFLRYERINAFMLRLLPSYASFWGNKIDIKDPIELHVAQKKLIHLAQVNLFPVKINFLPLVNPLTATAILPRTHCSCVRLVSNGSLTSLDVKSDS